MDILFILFITAVFLLIIAFAVGALILFVDRSTFTFRRPAGSTPEDQSRS
jgi:hypothetical protein